MLLGLAVAPPAAGSERVIDIPTRSGVTQRFLLVSPERPKAAAILFAGGHGGLQIGNTGTLRWGRNNFLVRARAMFAESGLLTAVVDAPSDRQSPPYLNRFRQTREHVEDIKAVIAWLRRQADLPVWLVGTSRGTQSAAHVAIRLPRAEGGPDGLVLTSTVLRDPAGRPVPAMALDKITIPTLVVHHEEDGCRASLFGDLPLLLEGLTSAPRKEVMAFGGGVSQGDPCDALSYHGFNGLEREVVSRIAEWILRAC